MEYLFLSPGKIKKLKSRQSVVNKARVKNFFYALFIQIFITLNTTSQGNFLVMAKKSRRQGLLTSMVIVYNVGCSGKFYPAFIETA
jgi:hypothetical protein